MVVLADAVAAYGELSNWVRPHEALGFVTPMSRFLAAHPELHLSEPETVQRFDPGQSGRLASQYSEPSSSGPWAPPILRCGPNGVESIGG